LSVAFLGSPNAFSHHNPQKKADEAGVIFSNSDGDQPGVIMNLFRWVKAIGLRPVLCGNIKGFHNVRRNPETQAEFARQTKQNAYMVTSFCDGTKVLLTPASVVVNIAVESP
jgi:predicted homoserine dehydrogenase-like protein